MQKPSLLAFYCNYFGIEGLADPELAKAALAARVSEDPETRAILSTLVEIVAAWKSF